jgi:CheY-like chemotaxis protein
MKSEFIANINHEVRTPMNAIIGYTEMLANSQLGPREKRFVAIIHKSSMALVSIFNDIMELSKIDSGRLQIMVSTVRLKSIINEVDGLFKDLAEEKGIRLSCRIAGHLPQSFTFDGLRLKQILQNLVSNAVKFTREGSVTLLVDGGPSTAQQGCFDLNFIIEDTGIGICAADQQKIFELFRQGEDVITKQYGGVGLGLTLCSRLTKMMGGSIDVHSVEGQGTRFTVRLTGIQIAQQAPADLESDRLAAGFEREGKLLVVDDVDLIKDVFIDYFQDSPYKVLTANNGEDALSIAIAEHPDIIFMDLNLSGTDGRNVTEQLRQMAETVSIPVVVMTGEMLEEEDFRPLFDDFLQKPFRLEALKGIVARYARPSSKQELQPAVLAGVDEDEHLLTSQVAAAWNMDLDLLRQQAAFSGSLTDAASLGVAMQLRGEAEHQPVLTRLGEELLLHAHEPNILGVDRVLAKLSRIAHREES